ncbi:MAG: hypothetical protein LBN39_02105 [Planctomycetaceae bacterium]|jgi:hypothetical protein|nr:hypothetical protein [Planctomycetaceae bacterium]
MSNYKILYLLSAVYYSLFIVHCSLPAAGLSPKSPEVQQAVDNAVGYLKKNASAENRLGGRALAAMAIMKAGANENHPFVLATIKDIQKTIAPDGSVTIDNHIYTAGIIVLFLGDFGPDKYRRELEAFGNFLYKNQRKDGAWTYLTSGTADAYPSGDMSMTQYGVMAMWTLRQLDINVSNSIINRAAQWLMVAQNPQSGAFAYQTTISQDWNTINRSGERLSMTAAGMASVYVCRDLFRYNGNNVPKADGDKIHEAFQEFQENQDESEGRFTVSKSRFEAAQKRGNVWLESHFFPITSSTEYYFYYLYAFERYAAFRELAENKFHESPPWYDKTAEFLLKNQKEDGSWQGQTGAQVDTAYAVLFLLRSTNKTFEKIVLPNRYGGGNMLGGRGLPKLLTDDIKVQDGKIVSLSEIGDTAALAEKLEDLEKTDDAALKQLAQLPADEVEKLLRKNKLKMKALVGHEQPERRLAAVQIFGKSGEVSNALPLIYALTDPDPAVAQAALDALCRLARIPKNEKLPEDLEKRINIINRWKVWYRSVVPDAVFEER